MFTEYSDWLWVLLLGIDLGIRKNILELKQKEQMIVASLEASVGSSCLLHGFGLDSVELYTCVFPG